MRRLSVSLGLIALIAAACTADDGAGTDEREVNDSAPPEAADAPTTGVPVDPTTAGPATPDSTTTTTTTSTTTPSTSSSTTTTTTTVVEPVPSTELEIVSFPVPAGSRPHDVAPALDGGVWYTAQRSEALGYLDPATGETRHIQLGSGSAPHGVIVDDSGVPWITDGGLNAIVSVDPATDEVTVYPLPPDTPNANLNTAAFDGDGLLWFTGQEGIYGVLDPVSGELDVYPSPRGSGPYGITATPDGQVYFASLAGNYVGFVAEGGLVVEIDPPTPDQGARRVWSDSSGTIWVSEWRSGQLSRYDPVTGTWQAWPLPGADPATYAVYVDGADQVWVSDFGGNALHRFDPATETFETFPLPANPGNVRQILGRGSEIWGAQSADDSLVVIRPTT